MPGLPAAPLAAAMNAVPATLCRPWRGCVALRCAALRCVTWQVVHRLPDVSMAAQGTQGCACRRHAGGPDPSPAQREHHDLRPGPAGRQPELRQDAGGAQHAGEEHPPGGHVQGCAPGLSCARASSCRSLISEACQLQWSAACGVGRAAGAVATSVMRCPALCGPSLQGFCAVHFAAQHHSRCRPVPCTTGCPHVRSGQLACSTLHPAPHALLR